MDVCSHIGLSINDVTSLHGFCVDTLESAYGVLGDFSLDELGFGVTKFLNIQDDIEEVSDSISSHGKCVFQTENVYEEAPRSELTIGATENPFSKGATFSCSTNTLSSALEAETNGYADDETNAILKHDDVSESVNLECLDSSSIPSPLKPISAMKGTRAKHGLTPPHKLTVIWAPDVYDPIPTSVSHMLQNSPRKHNKKKSKNKQKNTSNTKSSRGGNKGKDKKQIRKRDTGFKLFDKKEQAISFSEFQPSAVDFHVGIPDLFCGSSFVNRYDSSFHLSSLAEAT